MKNHLTRKIVVIGGGVIGNSTAWHLSNLGHEVILVDPLCDLCDKKNTNIRTLNGTTASLGVLMGNIYSKHSGRGWKLRTRSMELWPLWISKLKLFEKELIIQKPLIKLAESEAEKILIENIYRRKNHLKIELLSKNIENKFLLELPKHNFGGIISYEDGRLDPIKLQHSFNLILKQQNITLLKQTVKTLERNRPPEKYPWSTVCDDKKIIKSDNIILCTALGTNNLLKNLNHEIPMEPILGQAFEIETNKKRLQSWPGVISTKNYNLIPTAENKLLIGATIENSLLPKEINFNNMRTLNGLAPTWISQGDIKSKWYGLRARPLGTSSPVLEEIEKGLIVATCHYRNGVLLAPATAEWVGEKVT